MENTHFSVLSPYFDLVYSLAETPACKGTDTREASSHLSCLVSFLTVGGTNRRLNVADRQDKGHLPREFVKLKSYYRHLLLNDNEMFWHRIRNTSAASMKLLKKPNYIVMYTNY